ncbi:SH3 domain-containing protein [Comamonas terrigena]|uniref:SH3 domain-containing protein n=1 Tax=Comamonas terrigena TaxID=32013 RepID=UPI003C7CEB61
MFTAALHRVHRSIRSSLPHALLAAATLAASWTALPSAARAPEFVSVKGNSANVRAQPQARAQVQWELSKGYPLQVTARQGNWLKVRDYESALGWVYRPNTSTQAHHVVKARTANLRNGPGANHRVIGKLEQHEVVRTLEKRAGWAKVRSPSGTQGWVARSLLWGW